MSLMLIRLFTHVQFMHSGFLSFCFLCLSGCDFISTASELTFGEGSLPSMKQEMVYPSVDDFVSFDESDMIPGLPDSLNEGTLAHLVGARVHDNRRIGLEHELARFVLLDF